MPHTAQLVEDDESALTLLLLLLLLSLLHLFLQDILKEPSIHHAEDDRHTSAVDKPS
jgi:hypothetical protein